jgi:hypothetical protein
MLAQVVDDPWGPLVLAKGAQGGSAATDHAWVTRREAAAQYFRDARMSELLGRMLPRD